MEELSFSDIGCNNVGDRSAKDINPSVFAFSRSFCGNSSSFPFSRVS